MGVGPSLHRPLAHPRPPLLGRRGQKLSDLSLRLDPAVLELFQVDSTRPASGCGPFRSPPASWKNRLGLGLLGPGVAL